MIVELGLSTQFLYYTLGLIATGSVYSSIKRINKVDKLANNDIKDYKELKKILGNDGLQVSKNIQLKEKYDLEGICLIGPTGAGKTTSLFLNNLLNNDIRGSYIVTDPKGELFELTSGYQKKVCGRKVYKVDFTNTDYSERYNLLANCKNSEEVIQLASNLLLNGALSIELASGKKAGGVEWIQMAEPLLAAALLYVKDLEKPFNTIEFALQLILNLNNEQLKGLIDKSKNIDAITQYDIFLMVGGADRTEGSIKITLASNMKLFTTRDVNKISIDTTFNIEDFRNEESILYVIYPERKSNYLAPFIAPFFSQVIDKLLDYFRKGCMPIHLLFEEMGNIGMLSNMSINAATIRSRNMSLTACLQGITQLQQVYGINNSKTILNNLKTKLVLPGVTDIDTINYISSLCGVKEINTKSINYSVQNQSINNSKAKKKIFEDGELRTLEDNTVLIISNNKMPVIDELSLYYETDLKENVIEKVKYKKYVSSVFNFRDEIERIKASSNEQELEDDNARRTLRQIFTEKG